MRADVLTSEVLMVTRMLAFVMFALMAGHDMGVRAEPPERLLQQLPTAGIRFATAREPQPGPDEGHLVIAEIDAAGFRVLHDAPLAKPGALLWLDAERLLVLGGLGWAEKKPFVQRFVAGRPEGPHLEARAVIWHLRPGEELGSDFQLGRDRKGRPWLVHCLLYRGLGESACRQWISLPIDFDAGTFGPPIRRRPPGFVAATNPSGTIDPQRARRVPAPAGYSLQLHTEPNLHNENVTGARTGVPAFTCKGPDGTSTWPHMNAHDWLMLPRPRDTRWLMQDPPLYLVSGPMTDPVGQHGYGTLVFRGCTREPLEDVALTRTPVWLELRYPSVETGVHGTVWTVHLGPHELATIIGSAEFLAFAPP